MFNILCVHRMYPILLIIGSKLILTSKVNFELQKIVTHCKSFLLEFKIAKKCHQEKFHCILWYLLYISIFCLSKSPFSVFSPSSLCFWTSWPCSMFVATPLWGKCEDETHTPKSGNLKSSGTPKNSKLDCSGQNTFHWGDFYIVGKVLKCRCRKWPCMSHLDICSTSYGRMKGWKSNWQFDSRPLKVRIWPDPGMCRWNATHRWKALEESYKFALDLIPIRDLNWELWASIVSGVETETVSGLLLGSLKTKTHSDVGAMGKHREYYMGEGGGFPRVRAVVSQVSSCCPWLVPTPKVILNVN